MVAQEIIAIVRALGEAHNALVRIYESAEQGQYEDNKGIYLARIEDEAKAALAHTAPLLSRDANP